MVAGAHLRREERLVTEWAAVRLLRLPVETTVYSKGRFRVYRGEPPSHLPAGSALASGLVLGRRRLFSRKPQADAELWAWRYA